MRYFFDLELDDGIPAADEEGMILADLRAAKVEAARSLCDIAKAAVEGGQPLTALTVTVRGDEGPVLTAVFRMQMTPVN